LFNNIKEWYRLLGKYYGYPKCCIDIFILEKKRTRIQRYIDRELGLGFIPCNSCVKKIVDGKIRIEELIKGRIFSKVFALSSKKERISKLRGLISINNYYKKKVNNK